MPPTPNFRAEFLTPNDPKWYQNGVVLATKDEADSYAQYKLGVWMGCTGVRVVETDDPVSFTWDTTTSQLTPTE